MKVRILATLAVVGSAAALSGCVSFGNTHALITPVGVAGIHFFKPAPDARDIDLPPQRNPDLVAATRKPDARDEET